MTDFWRKPATEIAQLVRIGAASAAEITEDALARLDAVNPAINAVVQVMADEARAAAEEADLAVSRNERLPPLTGVPVTVKVNVDQLGHATTNGLRLQKDLVAQTDSPVVANLRKAGAIIIGRTNTPAFSLRWFCRNSLHGHTTNPLNPAITPGGSSGGAAAATAAGIGCIGHGTDIAGSIRYPAYACGLHGLRPTLGRIPAVNFTGAERHIGGQLMAVSGPLARTIADVKAGFEAMAGQDLRDPWWVPVPFDLPEQPRRAALTIAPEGMKVDKPVEDALREAARRLEAAGWEVEEVTCPPLREPAALQLRLWLAEFRRSGASVVAREDDPDSSFVFEQLCRHSSEVDVNGLLDTLQQRATFVRDWQLFLERHSVCLMPVSGELPFKDLLDVESPGAFDRVLEAQLPQCGLPLMGLPGLTVNMGLTQGNIPVGVQVVGGRYREDTMLAAGEVIEAGNTPFLPVDPARA